MSQGLLGSPCGAGYIAVLLPKMDEKRSIGQVVVLITSHRIHSYSHMRFIMIHQLLESPCRQRVGRAACSEGDGS